MTTVRRLKPIFSNIPNIPLANVFAIEEHPPLHRVVVPQQQLHDGALATGG
jgi:hypothetical protein